MRRDEADGLVNSLFTTWYSPLVRYAWRSTRSMAAAEDIVQESFKELYRNLIAGRQIDSPKAWTLCVVRREIIRRGREEAQHGGPFYSLADIGDVPQALEAAERKPWQESELADFLKVLSRREEEVLLLRVQSLKYQQIGEALGLSVNSVKTLLARGLRKMQQLRKSMSRETGGEYEDVEIARRTLQ